LLVIEPKIDFACIHVNFKGFQHTKTNYNRIETVRIHGREGERRFIQVAMAGLIGIMVNITFQQF
jgi:hypothetical protein